MSNNLSPAQRFDPYKHGLASGVDDVYSASLGPAPRIPAPNGYEGKSYSRINMLAAYEGKNLVIRDTMEDYMLTAEWDFYTKYILPWFRTDQIHMSWSEWQNNPHYMGVTPHQTTSRVITKKRIIRKASIVRRGIAYEFEGDHMNTSEGRSSYYASVAAIARSFQETANVEVLRALRHCHRYNQATMREFELVPKGDLDAYHNRISERFMIVQKTTSGMETINTLVDQDLELTGGRANVWIVGREISDYLDVVPPDKKFFMYAGQEGVDRLNGRPQNRVASGNTMGNLANLQPTRMVKDTPVFIAKSYQVEGIGKADLLSRITEVGIYNTMFDRTNDYTRYRKEGRDRKVYSNLADGWEILRHSHVIENCGIWQTNGKLRSLIDVKGGRPGSNSISQDDSDFLSFFNPTAKKREEIEYFGDMQGNFVKPIHFLNAAETLLNAVTYGDNDERKQLMRNFVSEDEATRNAAIKTVVDRLKGIVGENNLFLKGDAIAQFTANLVASGSAGARPQDIASSVDNNMENEHQSWLREIVGAAVPEPHKARMEAIVQRSNESWKTRAAAIRDLVIERREADPSSIPSMVNKQEVDDWFKIRASRYETRMASLAGNARSTPVAPVRSRSNLPPSQWMPAFHVAGNARVGARFTSRAPGAAGGESEAEMAARQRASQVPAVEVGNARFKNMAANVDAIYVHASHGLLRALAVLYCGIEFNRDRLIALNDHNVAVLVNWMLVRAHGTYKTRFGIKVAANGGAGFCAFGHSDMSMGHDPARKVGFLHYTAYLSAIVTDPKNVVVVEDLYCQRYLGGQDITFWTPEHYKQSNTRRARSIIVYPLPPTRTSVEKRIDIRGRWYTEHRLGFVTDDRYERPLFEGAARMNILYGLHDASRTDAQSSRGRIPRNFVCSQGMEWYFNTITGAWDDYTVEQSPFGHKVYPGCGKVRDGYLQYLEDPGYFKR